MLRESKSIIDKIAESQFISRKEVSRIVAPSFQATGIDGEMMVLRLVAPGLYTAQYMGSLSVPNQPANLHWLRTKCVPRLVYMKKHAVKNAKLLTKIINKESRTKRRKSTTMLRSPSYDSDDEMFEPWTRGSWFPPSRPDEKIVVPKNIL
ncbi:hypothetical protein BJV82DRAFT_598376 [Fennellomyces sp. T-0311]|nr:hypothetical protein BJV82DRAFT_598376 [Fennellomyces sp. T-0311]